MRRQSSGKFIFIPPDSVNEANQRRSQSISRLQEIKQEIHLLDSEKSELTLEVEMLNKFLRTLSVQEASY